MIPETLEYVGSHMNTCIKRQSQFEADRPKTITYNLTTTKTKGLWNVRTIYPTGKTEQLMEWFVGGQKRLTSCSTKLGSRQRKCSSDCRRIVSASFHTRTMNTKKELIKCISPTIDTAEGEDKFYNRLSIIKQDRQKRNTTIEMGDYTAKVSNIGTQPNIFFRIYWFCK
ncbi:hypothetical protein DPMN_154461 [Dreissena polymorpha]|uniref:Uncharacterized protein n=1 Tax=Dreissena polymorpha TaxID=45954 RepID=A0A9D4FP97_DREPO|nr:hypothetical protein DPMN_154461 [Dreissena polymorpha]